MLRCDEQNGVEKHWREVWATSDHVAHESCAVDNSSNALSIPERREQSATYDRINVAEVELAGLQVNDFKLP